MPSHDDRVTTVKVPRSLRERIARNAAATGQSAAAFLADAVDRWERDQRLAAVRAAYSGSTDSDYRAEINAWDQTAVDGTDA